MNLPVFLRVWTSQAIFVLDGVGEGSRLMKYSKNTYLQNGSKEQEAPADSNSGKKQRKLRILPSPYFLSGSNKASEKK